MSRTSTARGVAPYVERLLGRRGAGPRLSGLEHGLSGDPERLHRQGVPARRRFTLDENGDYAPILHNVKRLAAVCTYGGDAGARS